MNTVGIWTSVQSNGYKVSDSWMAHHPSHDLNNGHKIVFQFMIASEWSANKFPMWMFDGHDQNIYNIYCQID